jgi:hypothetical protein
MALREIRFTDAEPADRVMESPPPDSHRRDDKKEEPFKDSRTLSARETELLLDRLCTRLGFCLPGDAQANLKANPPAAIDDFVSAVFLAEGIDPATANRHLYRQVRQEVEEAFIHRQPS